MDEGVVRGVDKIVTGRRNHGFGCKRARRIDGGLMIEVEASGGYGTNGRFKNVPQTEQPEGSS